MPTQGWKGISVKQEAFDELQKIADASAKSVSELLLELVMHRKELQELSDFNLRVKTAYAEHSIITALHFLSSAINDLEVVAKRNRSKKEKFIGTPVTTPMTESLKLMQKALHRVVPDYKIPSNYNLKPTFMDILLRLTKTKEALERLVNYGVPASTAMAKDFIGILEPYIEHIKEKGSAFIEDFGKIESE